jgi:hypothetical protein
VNGQLVDETLLQMVEKLGSSDMSEMQTNFAAIETCSGMRKSRLRTNFILNFCMINETGGMDECDTAAMIYQCGQEKAPNLVANVISAIEVNSSAVSKKKHDFI